jgi:hypothetical protein
MNQETAMNASSTSPFPPCRPGTDPVFGQLGGGLIRTSLRSLRLQWILYRAARRKTRTIEPWDNMNVHMLRDIGVSQETLSRAGDAKAVCERQRPPVSALRCARGTRASRASRRFAELSARAARQEAAQASSVPMAGGFAGEYVNGAPVYRFSCRRRHGSRTRWRWRKSAGRCSRPVRPGDSRAEQCPTTADRSRRPPRA